MLAVYGAPVINFVCEAFIVQCTLVILALALIAVSGADFLLLLLRLASIASQAPTQMTTGFFIANRNRLVPGASRFHWLRRQPAAARTDRPLAARAEVAQHPISAANKHLFKTPAWDVPAHGKAGIYLFAKRLYSATYCTMPRHGRKQAAAMPCRGSGAVVAWPHQMRMGMTTYLNWSFSGMVTSAELLLSCSAISTIS